MIYRVKLDVFEGPFDLLLFLIRKNEVDIYDIPIFKITEQFLSYIEAMQILDLDVAGDFIEMCAMLMSIKSRYLLPQPDGDEDDFEDPRLELVERLLEYQRYKEVSYDLEDMAEERSRLHGRTYFDFVPKTEKIGDDEYLDEATLFDLVMAFRQALADMPKIHEHTVTMINMTTEQQADWIVRKLDGQKMLLFRDLMARLEKKIEIIVTFVALLTLIKKGIVHVSQSGNFEEIRIRPGRYTEEEVEDGH